MPDIILHHYQGSPYAEKIRLIFGHKNLTWKSVEVPTIPPRPELESIFGEFRRIPILQIGADFFCDTRLIAEVIEQLHPQNPLIISSDIISTLISGWVEPRAFIMTGFVRFQRKEDVQNVFEGQVSARKFSQDRFSIMQPAMTPENFSTMANSAEDHLIAYLRTIEHHLSDGREHINGDHPTIADFSIYHTIWWLKAPPQISRILNLIPLVNRWSKKIAAIGHGTAIPTTSEAALTAISKSTKHWKPSWELQSDIRLGNQISIRPDDYAQKSLTGKLISSTIKHISIERQSEHGTVRIHLPRLGYEITELPI